MRIKRTDKPYHKPKVWWKYEPDVAYLFYNYDWWIWVARNGKVSKVSKKGVTDEYRVQSIRDKYNTVVFIEPKKGGCQL